MISPDFEHLVDLLRAKFLFCSDSEERFILTTLEELVS